MIVESLIDALCSLLLSLFSVINIPEMPESVTSAVATATEYLATGYGILDNFVEMSVVGPLITAFLVIDVAYHVYIFVMWIVRKIPFLGIK